MTNILSKLDRKSLSLAKAIGELAQDKGVGAYLVGGSVRDLLIKRKIVDMDFVIESDAIKVAEEFARSRSGQCVRYPAFKTATVILQDATVIDFVSSRREVYAHHGALPVVTASGIDDDLFRRDFTVNAMAVSVTPSTFGVLVDPYNGFGDLKTKTIRILHPKSFMDDPTRLLRAIRFEVRLHFKMDKETLRLFKDALSHKAISYVKPPRYFEEFKKILKEEHVNVALLRLRQLQALRVPPLELIFNDRRVNLLKEVNKSINFCQRHAIKGIEPWIVYLMSILEEEKPDDLFFALGQLGVSGNDKDKLISSLSFPKTLGKLSSVFIKPSAAHVFLKPFSTDVLVFFRSQADAVARRRIDRYLTYDRHLRLSIDGDDIKGIGIPAGHRMKQVLAGVLAQVVDGKIKTKEHQLKCARLLGGE